ncbi:MAG: peroxidase family protein, partial [Myxococcota bacterium]
NEQAALTAMHTLFVREHNRLARLLRFFRPHLSGDEIYARARRIVGAEMQAITFNEFLPLLLGKGALTPYAGYDPAVDAGISNLFSTASYRFGHSLLSEQLLRLRKNGKPIAAGHLPLRDAFFAPARITDEGGIAPLLRGLAKQRCQEVDTKVVDAVRNFLFGPPGAGGFDLAALNIQRGRDHGLPGYNQTRVALGLAPVASFQEITSDDALADALEALYGDVNDVDVWVGGLAEDHLPGAMVGELVFTVLKDQFERLRDGDRFWYERAFSKPMRAWLSQTRLSHVIRRNTASGRRIQKNVFVVKQRHGRDHDGDSDSGRR